MPTDIYNLSKTLIHDLPLGTSPTLLHFLNAMSSCNYEMCPIFQYEKKMDLEWTLGTETLIEIFHLKKKLALSSVDASGEANLVWSWVRLDLVYL